MATVPGVPDRTVPDFFAPTQADMLMAAAIMHQQGKFQTAMDTSGMRPSSNIEDDRSGRYRDAALAAVKEEKSDRTARARQQMEQVQRRLEREPFPPPPDEK